MLKKIVHKTAVWFEPHVDKLFKSNNKNRVIEPYTGYATQDQVIVRGRVLTALRRNEARPNQSRWTNFKQIFSLFLTDEVANVRLQAGTTEAISDEEGYFQIVLPKEAAGWHDVAVDIVGRNQSTNCPVLIPRADAKIMVISDIDDTLLETGAYSLVRNLWTSFTGNISTRKIFEDAVVLLDALNDKGRNPIYYVSSSPWNLYTFLTEIFAKAGLVRGPMFLRDLGLSETQFITNGHGSHKGASIDTLLNATDLSVILIGDTGQKDAHIYLEAIKRHPSRIRAVVLREPGPGADDEDKAAIAALKATGVLCLHGRDFTNFTSKLLHLIED